ncbi:eyes absent homolog 3 isoform X1 [Parus major]|uniref:eyes absent homolog 3 isoform X1 n=2 Tax=Parus major TaxID=9157 RepID=UPI0007710A89|nr:eyes absent homolog 3 isoform X1 [Parus major]XP_015504803.1 eyes absent homolog 3 isoform X1 [Parus major]XP_015504805.1 eyes absent homolog 3 isoform X1 [Parus major]XP_015504806.1 eyes absent homolog 3 isoform X1 [Parus major]XP_033375447.1 eyes absent homolog 3 isoform X1 [Parus major]XP_033375448.1 eyes absent homolog 3 isoform X1 [Parus major]
MEEPQDLPEQPVKKAKMQESREQNLSHVSNTEVSDQKTESSNLGSNLPMSSEIMTCTDYIPRSSNDYTSQMYSAKPYAHILSVPVSETMSPYPAQPQYQALQQSQPYTIYPQTTQTYGLPPFGALWPGMKPESGLIQTPSTSQHSVLTCTTGLTTSQPSPAHYSYSIEASTTNASPVSTSSTVVNISTSAVASISQEYPTYTILGQSQYQSCYPSSGFGVVPPADSNTESLALATTTYPEEKPNALVLARAVQRPSSGDASTSPLLPRATASKELDEQARKNIPGKNRGKRKADTSSSQDSELERVFLWDLDETIIIFHSLLTGSYAQKYGKDPTLVIGSGLSMEEMIFEVADTHLFFNDLEECDQVHIEDVASDDNGQDLSNYNFSTDGFSGSGSNANHSSSVGVQGVDWMRKLAFRYRRVREIYNKYKTNVGGLLSPQKREALQRLRTDIEVLTDSWLETALKSLLLIQSRKNCENILITTTQLMPALAKVLLYGLGEVFPIENIYSATKIGKESCFERIVSRFGKKVTYVVIGDGRDEEVAAKQHNMPFWRITNHADLVSLHQALELDFL